MGEYVVIGLGRFGRSLAVELQSLGNDVIGIDIDRQLVQDISPLVHEAIEADASSEATLAEIGVTNIDAAIVAIGAAEQSILVTMILKKLGVEYVISKASNDLHGQILRRLGADRVVFPEKETAVRLAHGISVPEVVDYLSITAEMGISKLKVPSSLVGHSLGEASLEERFKVRLIAVVRRDRVIFGAPVGEKFIAGDVLILSGRDQDLRALAEPDPDRQG
jgi:trk system potassium uptake protein TrkA